ncbi:PadR family transcriptional regulator [Streptomyces sp. NPDC059506]|uniref:PadR family transcriptional regulator n=1 Tax=Streptomyces TaxID=1883 RepID=UPI000CC1B467|nr:PadR family transcriptional regulator [Streptomyces sp. SCUT-3]PLW74481.1 PadR family transcriptional regulator [Streptomyces sp. DJ]QMV22356.1 PadR family transcriptional regulator [Streptomyces sp. SCUT-3]
METPSPAWLRAVLPLCLLSTLERGESYGYALLQQIEESGLGAVKGAVLYPALTRLADDGAVEVRWAPGEGGPGRKYYRLTEAGRERLLRERRAWRAFSAAVGTTVDGPRAPHGTDTLHERENDR